MTTTPPATPAPTTRERMRAQWERRRAETDHRTYAVPFDRARAVALPPAEYDRWLAMAIDADRRMRASFDVMVLA